MVSRYTVRATGSGYCVWDAERNAIATSPDGFRQYDSLRIEEAFALIDQLTGEQDTDERV
jgi:hypothetical protein